MTEAAERAESCAQRKDMGPPSYGAQVVRVANPQRRTKSAGTARALE